VERIAEAIGVEIVSLEVELEQVEETNGVEEEEEEEEEEDDTDDCSCSVDRVGALTLLKMK